ncbi:hypothetical protein ASJ78_04663 [Serratia marcescens]|nr:hypothetical protein ASJ78_04663 [Serratia marcescens]
MMKKTMNKSLWGRRSLLPLVVAGSLAMAGVSAHADDNDDNSTLFGISLPQVNDSNIGYGKNASVVAQ